MAFALVNLLALVAAVGFGNRNMLRRYDNFALEQDVLLAENMASFFNGQKNVNPEISTDAYLQNLAQQLRARRLVPPRDKGIRRSEHKKRLPRNREGQWLLTDSNDQFVFSTARTDQLSVIMKNRHGLGAEILRGGEVVGYLYVNRMFQPFHPWQDQDNHFWENPSKLNWLFSGFVFLITLVLGFLLTMHIVRPVKALNSAASQVKKGNLKVQVNQNRRDEMGDLARSFNEMTRSLDAVDLQRRQFVANAAHELRTPVSIIRTRIEMMEEGLYSLDGENLSALAQETDRLIDLISELKTLSVLESTELPMEKLPINLGRLIKDMIHALEPAVLKNSIEVDVDFPENLPEIQANEGKMGQLFTNLISNALHYAEKYILISIEMNKEKQLEIRVEDDGSGIAPANRERVFERFYRVDSSRNRQSGGTGLGLSICRQIVNRHGGQIRVDSSARFGGAAMIVVFPASPQTG